MKATFYNTRISKHAENDMARRNISVDGVLRVINEGELVSVDREAVPGPVYRVDGDSPAGKRATSRVVYRIEGDVVYVIITTFPRRKKRDEVRPL